MDKLDPTVFESTLITLPSGQRVDPETYIFVVGEGDDAVALTSAHIGEILYGAGKMFAEEADKPEPKKAPARKSPAKAKPKTEPADDSEEDDEEFTPKRTSRRNRADEL